MQTPVNRAIYVSVFKTYIHCEVKKNQTNLAEVQAFSGCRLLRCFVNDVMSAAEFTQPTSTIEAWMERRAALRCG